MHAEPFVDATRAAAHLSVTRRYLLDRVRCGELPAYPLRKGKRHEWRFRLSELEKCLEERKDSSAAPFRRRTNRSRQIPKAENGQ
jgi:hypothetical protein